MTPSPRRHSGGPSLGHSPLRVLTATGLAVTMVFGAPGAIAQTVPDDHVVDAVLADPDSVVPSEPDPLAEHSALDGALELVPESVREVPAAGPQLERAEADLLTLETTILTNRSVRDQAADDLERLDGERRAHRARISSLRDRRRAAGQRAAQLEAELGELAVAAYVGAGDPAPGLTLDPSSAIDAGRQQTMVEAVDSTLRDRLAVARSEVSSLGQQVSRTHDDLEAVREQIDLASARHDHAVAELAVAEPALPDAQDDYRAAFMVSRVEGADFSVVALDAYRSAADQINAEHLSCRLSWSVLAGIGRVESRHGTFAGSSLGEDGRTTRRIIGIALDGSDGIVLIPDTDGGALDGDPVFDRAVGPMQFIPSTWRMVRRDGNGDGRMDPHNIYDASAAAAAYLCRSQTRLDLPTRLNAALLTYNRSQPYVSSVLSHRRAYDRLQLPEGSDN